ncbi:hypothetical protein WMY93_011597 [Mugilogobius chulae]|uniref:Transmembrane protein 88 n=1 Tax=Mugilogobius chulae TaxID=88201 RepID=A0AAW0P6A6_9GOBI
MLTVSQEERISRFQGQEGCSFLCHPPKMNAQSHEHCPGELSHSQEDQAEDSCGREEPSLDGTSRTIPQRELFTEQNCTMSLSRNGTLEKPGSEQTQSEMRSPSRAGISSSALINGLLASLVFGTILTPALAMIIFGFLCHSTVQPHGTSVYCSDLLDDGGCVALLVVGFLLLTPLLVLALAAYCRLARHLQLGLCFIPYSRAVYKEPACLPSQERRELLQPARGSRERGQRECVG